MAQTIKILIIMLTFLYLNTFSSTYSTNTDLRFIQICNETSPISVTTMNKVLINKKLSGENSNNFKCFLHCLFTKYKWMDEDGGFFLTQIRHVLEETGSIEPTLLDYVLYKCTAITSVDRCQRAFQFTECFWERVHDHTEEDEVFLYNLENKQI